MGGRGNSGSARRPVSSGRGRSTSQSSSSSQITGESLMALHASTRNVNDRVAISALRDARNEVTGSARGIQRTLNQAATPEGVHNSQFNDASIRTRLQRILGNDYEFRRVTVSENTTIPGFNFMGMPVRGNIAEWRLFKKSSSRGLGSAVSGAEIGQVNTSTRSRREAAQARQAEERRRQRARNRSRYGGR